MPKDSEPKRTIHRAAGPSSHRNRSMRPTYIPEEKPLDWPPGYVPRAARETIMESRGRGIHRTSEQMPHATETWYMTGSPGSASLDETTANTLFEKRKRQREARIARLAAHKETLPESRDSVDLGGRPRKDSVKINDAESLDMLMWNIAISNTDNSNILVGDLNAETQGQTDHDVPRDSNSDSGGETKASQVSSTDSRRSNQFADSEPPDSDS